MRDKNELLAEGLCHEHSIEWILMMKRQARHGCSVPKVQGKVLYASLFDFMFQVFGSI